MLPILSTRHRQRGAVGLVAALFLILVVLIMGQVTLRLAGTGANDSLLTHDGVGALLLAETGLERAAGQLGANAPCDSGLAGSWGYAGGNVAIANLGAGFTTDFDGSALASGQCRVRVTGTAGMFGAQRVVEAVIGTAGGNLLDPNADFDDLSCVGSNCRPLGWSVTSTSSSSDTGWNLNGGTGGSPAAEFSKFGGNTQPTTIEHGALTPFTVTAPTSLTITFDYNVDSPPGHSVQVEFELSRTGTAAFPYSGARSYTGTTGGFVSDAITINIAGTGPVTIDGFRLVLFSSPGPARDLWLDNLVMTGAGGGGGAGIERWREIIN